MFLNNNLQHVCKACVEHQDMSASDMPACNLIDVRLKTIVSLRFVKEDVIRKGGREHNI